MGRRAIAGIVATMAVALTLPAVAEAGTASMREYGFWDESGELVDWYAPRFEAHPGEKNTVGIRNDGAGRWVFTDSTAPLTPGAHCRPVNLNVVVCAPPSGRYFNGEVELLDGDDSIVITSTWHFGIEGGDGDDELTAGPGRDGLFGGPGTDTLNGGDGDEYTLDGGPGADTMDGDAGIDVMSYRHRTANQPVSVTLDGIRNDGADPDRSGVSSAAEEGDRDVEIETVYGGDGHDRLTGSDLTRDYLYGGEGNDLLDGGRRGDRLRGAEGGDTVTYASRGSDDPVAVTLAIGQPNDGADPNRDGRSSGSEEGDDIEEVEHVTGGAGPDILAGSASRNSLYGLGGRDRLDGGPAADLLHGGESTDTITYASRPADGGVAVVLDGLRNDGADPDGDGLSSAEEEGDRDVSIEDAAGGAGPDVLRAVSDAINRLFGNAGNDRLYARDGTAARDQLACGDGADARQADPSDAISSCESRLP